MYKIRNPKVQAKIIDLLGKEEYYRCMQHASSEWSELYNKHVVVAESQIPGTEISITITGDAETEFQRDDVYYPYSWNEFPKVIPPDDSLMELELYIDQKEKDIIVLKTLARYKDSQWIDEFSKEAIDLSSIGHGYKCFYIKARTAIEFG